MMRLWTRTIRLLKADFHGVMDQLENPELLLKQHLREMQASLMQKEANFKRICQARDQARQDYERGQQEHDRLEADLKIALKNDKDDIGRMLIKKLKPLSDLQANRRRHIDRISHDVKQLREYMDRQRSQYEQLRQKATVYLHRAEQQRWKDLESEMQSDFAGHGLSEEEIELELLQRKEAIKGGAIS